jgi:hypothetical protein
MRQPLQGEPRRPAVIRVASPAEAELLEAPLATSGIALEIAAPLEALEEVQEQMAAMFGGLTHDYRTQSTQAGETLSAPGLVAFFNAAKAFYLEEMWTVYGDEVMFEIVLEPASGPDTTLYGILMGSMGEEFGLALFRSFDDLQQFHEISLEHLDEIAPPPSRGKKSPDPAQVRREAEAMDEVLQVPSIGLTYTPQRDVAPALVKEAQQLKLPLASKSAFPLVMCTGQGGMRVATATDLAAMFSALQAILDWDARIDDIAEDDEIDVTVTSPLAAVTDFVPAFTAHTTLLVNPCLPEDDDEDDEDDDMFTENLQDIFTSLLTEPPGQSPAKKLSPGAAKKQGQANGKQSALSAAALNRVYTVDVALVGGPMAEDYEGEEIIRRIDILGRHTLHDLHEAIFDAFERSEEHLYEFNLGTGPGDRSQIYFYTGDWEEGDEGEGGDPEVTALAALDLQVGRRFGYTFDMGDQWEHVIEVVATTEATGKGKYPRVTKKTGDAPPQYPEDDEDDE